MDTEKYLLCTTSKLALEFTWPPTLEEKGSFAGVKRSVLEDDRPFTTTQGRLPPNDIMPFTFHHIRTTCKIKTKHLFTHVLYYGRTAPWRNCNLPRGRDTVLPAPIAVCEKKSLFPDPATTVEVTKAWKEGNPELWVRGEWTVQLLWF